MIPSTRVVALVILVVYVLVMAIVLLNLLIGVISVVYPSAKRQSEQVRVVHGRREKSGCPTPMRALGRVCMWTGRGCVRGCVWRGSSLLGFVGVCVLCGGGRRAGAGGGGDQIARWGARAVGR
jgi:hypothetical protein